MESWRKVYRDGVSHCLSTPALQALACGLQTGDLRIIPGQTTQPPPLQCMVDFPVEGGCPLCYAMWIGDGLSTVGQVEEAFGRLCFNADSSLGESGAIRFLINWIDSEPWEHVRKELLSEVQRTLAYRLLP